MNPFKRLLVPFLCCITFSLISHPHAFGADPAATDATDVAKRQRIETLLVASP